MKSERVFTAVNWLAKSSIAKEKRLHESESIQEKKPNERGSSNSFMASSILFMQNFISSASRDRDWCANRGVWIPLLCFALLSPATRLYVVYTNVILLEENYNTTHCMRYEPHVSRLADCLVLRLTAVPRGDDRNSLVTTHPLSLRRTLLVFAVGTFITRCT